MWHQSLEHLLLAALMMSLLVFRFRPALRRTLFNALLFYMASLATLAISSLLFHAGYHDFGSGLRETGILAEGLALLRLSSIFLFHFIFPLLRLHPPSILIDILTIIAYVVWGMVWLHNIGLDLSGIVTTSAIITAVIAFSMQDTLGNILGGVALQLDKSIQLGDWIKVADTSGRVVDINWRSTSIETRNWETVVIPNSVLMKNQFLILGRRTGEPEEWRRWIWFNVLYTTPPEKVIQVIENAVRMANIRGVASRPAPNCVMMDYGDSYARYALRYWLTDLALDDPTDSSVRVHMFAAMQRHGITPATPEHTLHLIKETEKLTAKHHRHKIAELVAMLKRFDLFRSLTDVEFETLAQQLHYAPYVEGGVITRQGSIADWLFIIVSGKVQVLLEAANGQRRQLEIIDADKEITIAGEMGLITGEPRSATLVAMGEVQCYRLDKSSFENIVRSRPQIAEDIAAVMARRSARLEAVQKDLDEEARRRMMANQKSEVLGKIRRFFRL